MRPSAVLLSLAGAAFLTGAGAAATCNADNCARAATGTLKGSQSARLAACSSYQRCTVIPATTTISSTITVVPDLSLITVVATTVTQVSIIPSTVVATGSQLYKRDAEGALKQARQVSIGGATTNCPTSIPASAASSCTPASRYASACSCAGVTKSYVSVAAPVATTTVTVTAPVPLSTVPVATTVVVPSVSVTTIGFNPTPTFLILLVGGKYDGQYVGVSGSGGTQKAAIVHLVTDALQFYLDDAGHLLTTTGLEGNEDTTPEGEPVFLLSVADAAQYPLDICSVANNALQCSTVQNRNVLEACDVGSQLAGYDADTPFVGISSKIDQGCYATTFQLVRLN